jgi:hypothetical protein
MKKLFVLSMTFLFAFASLQAQTQKAAKEPKSERVALRKLEGNIVNERAKSAFSSDFMGATNVQSRRIGTFDEFSFTSKDGQKMKAFYDFDNKLVGTTQPKTFADLPVKAQEQIKKEYKDYTVGPVIFYDDNEANPTDMILYGVQFEDADNYFVELTKGDKKLVLHVSPMGSVFFFADLK